MLEYYDSREFIQITNDQESENFGCNELKSQYVFDLYGICNENTK